MRVSERSCHLEVVPGARARLRVWLMEAVNQP